MDQATRSPHLHLLARSPAGCQRQCRQPGQLPIAVSDIVRESNGEWSSPLSFLFLYFCTNAPRWLIISYQVAIALWSAQDRRPAGSIILYPAQNSTALLVGAIFLSTPLPEFVAYNPSVQMMLASPAISPRMSQHMHAPQGAYESLMRSTSNGHASTSYRQAVLPNIISPVSPDIKHDPYRFLMPRTHHATGYAMNADPNWPVVKEEESVEHHSFQAAHRYSRSQDQQQYGL